jgi:F-box protein 18 (helicase)
MRPAGASASRPASGGGFTTAARLREETRDACPSASPDVGPRGVPDSPAEVATRATSGFTSAGALLRAARASSPREPPATRAPPAPVPPPRAPAPRGDRSRPFDQWSEDEKAAWRAEKEAKRAAAERKKRARQTSRQGSIVAAMAAAADATRDPNSRAPVADDLPYQLIQRVLSRVPEACLRDARAVCRAWRDAVDDPTFVPFAKMARDARSQNARRRDAVAAWMNERGVTTPSGLIAFLAGETARAPPGAEFAASSSSSSPLRAPLPIDAFARAAEASESRARRRWYARDARWRGNSPNPNEDEDARATTIGAPGAGLSATIREIGRWRLVGRDGWATLAACVFAAAEDGETVTFLLDAARVAAEEASAGTDACARECLSEFISLVVAASSSDSWRRGIGPDAADKARLADLDAAVGHFELAETRRENDGKRTLTHEQHAIVSADLRAEQIMLVRAFAGTGKTTTLLEYVKRRPGHAFAYLTFNRQVMLEAERKFPPNTKALNFHRLAYKARGFAYNAKMLRGSLRPRHACAALGLPANDDRAALAIRTLEAFLRSADEHVTQDHAPPDAHVMKVYSKSTAMDRMVKSGRATPREDLAALATDLWESMRRRRDPNVDKDSSLPMTDAGYLKLYQLSKPRLDLEYDVLMLDEAQDAAPVMADIILQQDRCAKILVGDPHQEIYSFMGAKNAMAEVTASVPKERIVERHLRRSFRFGGEIAAVANAILRLKGEDARVLGARVETREDRRLSGIKNAAVAADASIADEEIVGACSVDAAAAVVDGLRRAETEAAVSVAVDVRRVLHSHAPRAGGGEGKRRQLAVLCRGNASLFEVAARVVQFPGVKVGVIGGLEALKLNQLEDIWRLSTKMEEHLDAITDKYVATFVPAVRHRVEEIFGDRNELIKYDSLDALRRVSTLQDDKEMLTRLSVVSRLKSGLPELLDRLREVDVGTERHDAAHFVLSTAHKAKGLEFSEVLLWDDFVDVSRVRRNGDGFVHDAFDAFTDSYTTEKVDADEINLAYVAATRAMRRLVVYPGLAHLRAEEGHAGFAAVRAVSLPDGPCRRSSPGVATNPLLAEVNDDRESDRELRERVGATRCARCDRTGADVAADDRRTRARAGEADGVRKNGEEDESSRFGSALALMFGRRPKFATSREARAAACFFGEASGQWWGGAGDVESDALEAYVAYRDEMERNDVGSQALALPERGAWTMFLCERCWGGAKADGRGAGDGDGDGDGNSVDEAWKVRTTTLERMSMVDVTSLLSAERRARRGDGSDDETRGTP